MADPAPRRNWMKWALVASLGLNLAAAGLIGGALLKGPPPGPGMSLWHYARSLPEPYRDDLGRALRDNRADWIGPREALRGQREAFAAVLTTEPFDAAAATEILAAQAEQMGSLAARGNAILVGQIARMSPEERAAYAKALKERRGGPPPGRR